MINSKYYKIPKRKEQLVENEIFVTSLQNPLNFIRYAMFLFDKRHLNNIKFKASGSAISNLVYITETLKKLVPRLHQLNKIFTLKYEQEYEPKEKGLDYVKVIRSVPILEVNFYKVLNDHSILTEPGYQPPIEDQVFSKIKLNYSFLLKKAFPKGKKNKQDKRLRGGFRGGTFRGQLQSKRGRGYSFGNQEKPL